MCETIGISKSKADKMFMKHGKEKIKKMKKLPPWHMIGNTRFWSINSILFWNENTEVVT